MAKINSPLDPLKEMPPERLTRLGSADNNAHTVGTDKIQNSDERDNDEDCLASEEAFQVEDIRIISVYRGDCFAYPQIATPKSPQEREFNRYVERLVARQFKDSRTGTRQKECEDGDEVDFAISYATPEFISINLIHSFCGASCHAFDIPVNYDLNAGRPIKSLSELFKPRSNYLKKIATYCVSELKRCEGFREGDEWFEKGTRPMSSNYDNWSLLRNGVSITFDEYQIAPGVYPGATVVIPFSNLQEMLRRDVKWFSRLPELKGEKLLQN